MKTDRRPLSAQRKKQLTGEIHQTVGELEKVLDFDSKDAEIRKLGVDIDSLHSEDKEGALRRIQAVTLSMRKDIIHALQIWPLLSTYFQELNTVAPLVHRVVARQGVQLSASGKNAMTSMVMMLGYHYYLRQLRSYMTQLCYLLSGLFTELRHPVVKPWMVSNGADLIWTALTIHTLTEEAFDQLSKMLKIMPFESKEAEDKLKGELESVTDNIVRIVPTLHGVLDFKEAFSRQPLSRAEVNAFEAHFQRLVDMTLDRLEYLLSIKEKSALTEDADKVLLRLPYMLQSARVLMLPKTFARIMKVLHGCWLTPEEGGSYRLEREIDFSPQSGGTRLLDFLSERGYLFEPGAPKVGTELYMMQIAINKRLLLGVHGQPMSFLDWELLSLSQIKRYGLGNSFKKFYVFGEPLRNESMDLFGAISVRSVAEFTAQSILADYHQDQLEEQERAKSLLTQSVERKNLFTQGEDDTEGLEKDISQLSLSPESPTPVEGSMPVFPDVEPWKKTVLSARQRFEYFDYSGARELYQQALPLLAGLPEQEKLYRPGILVEQGDTWLEPWRELFHDLSGSITTIRRFQQRIEVLDEEKITAVFAEYGGDLDFFGFRAVVANTPEGQRAAINVPSHQERMFFWNALKRVRDVLHIQESHIREALKLYKQAIEGAALSQGEMLMYRKIAGQLQQLLEQQAEARALAKTVRRTSEKMVRVLKITGTYKLGSSSHTMSWKSLLVRDMSSFGGAAPVVPVKETGLLQQLRRTPVANQFEWTLVPKTPLRLASREMSQTPLWQWRPVAEASPEEDDEARPVTFLHFDSEQMRRVSRTSGASVLSSATDISRYLREQLNSSHPDMVLACRSHLPEQVNQELESHEYLAMPVKWLGVGGK